MTCRLLTTNVLTLLTLLLAFPVAAWSTHAVRLPDIGVLQPGEIRSVVARGTIDRAGVVEVTFDYPADLVRIRSVSGGPDVAYRCPLAVIVKDTIVGRTGSIVVICDSAVAVTDADLFSVEIEALHGAVGMGLVVPTRFRLDYVDQPQTEFSGGSVSIEGNPDVLERLTDGITGNYPNPMSTDSRFVFTLQQAGVARFAVLNLQGRSVLDLGSVEGTAGENTLEVRVHSNELAQGAYVMQMVTDRGVVLHTFMVLD